MQRPLTATMNKLLDVTLEHQGVELRQTIRLFLDELGIKATSTTIQDLIQTRAFEVPDAPAPAAGDDTK